VAPAREEAYVLERMVEDLRQLTLAETRQLAFERRPIDLGEIAARAAEIFSAEAAEANMAFSVQTSESLPPALADPQRVGQVIGNLLSNALRYTPSGGQVALKVVKNGRRGALSVTDTGEGIAAEDLPMSLTVSIAAKIARPDERRAGVGPGYCQGLGAGHGGRDWRGKHPGPRQLLLVYVTPDRLSLTAASRR